MDRKALNAADEAYMNVQASDIVHGRTSEQQHMLGLEAAISAYLSSIGGVVCTREPAGAWYEDGTGCFHMSLNVELEEKKARENGHQIHHFHTPIEAGNGGDDQAWCQPNYGGKIHPQKFMVVYEDSEMGSAIFDDETEAREHFEKASIAWNCYLFGLLPRTPSHEGRKKA